MSHSINLPIIKKGNNGLQSSSRTSKIQSLNLNQSRERNQLTMQNLKQNLNDEFTSKKKGSLDLVLIGDLTGSMATYYKLLRTEFIKLSRELFQFIPDLQIGIIFYLDHGQGDPYTTKVCKITADAQSIQEFIQSTPTGNGGDAKEAVEDALYDALQINWRPKVNRSIVLFGDASGKEPHECPYQHSYFEITKELYEKQVTINSVYCRPGYSSQSLQALTPTGIGDFQKKVSNLNHPNFFSWLANVTGGMIIGINEVGDLLEIIKASAAKDAGVLDEYEASMKTNNASRKKLELIEISKKASQRKLDNGNRLRLVS